jgi:hypothetical protein
MKIDLFGYVRQTDRHVFKLNKQYLACGRRTDMKKKCVGVFLIKIFVKERAKHNSVPKTHFFFSIYHDLHLMVLDGVTELKS